MFSNWHWHVCPPSQMSAPTLHLVSSSVHPWRLKANISFFQKTVPDLSQAMVGDIFPVPFLYLELTYTYCLALVDKLHTCCSIIVFFIGLRTTWNSPKLFPSLLRPQHLAHSRCSIKDHHNQQNGRKLLRVGKRFQPLCSLLNLHRLVQAVPGKESIRWAMQRYLTPGLSLKLK